MFITTLECTIVYLDSLRGTVFTLYRSDPPAERTQPGRKSYTRLIMNTAVSGGCPISAGGSAGAGVSHSCARKRNMSNAFSTTRVFR
jgi:hypothetical protein